MTNSEQSATPTRKRIMARDPQTDAVLGTRADEPKLTKSAQIIELLSRPEGGTIEQLIAATGWLPHTIRAALTGLRKKGHNLSSEKPTDGGRIYRIIGGARPTA